MTQVGFASSSPVEATNVSAVEGFRGAMRRCASTVALITCGVGDKRMGMAATAVTSIAFNPPTLLIAINRAASISATLRRERRFCVNFLATRHHALVRPFGGGSAGVARFDHGRWETSDCGLPTLSDALGIVICSTVNTMDVGTHTLFIGAVEAVQTSEPIDPLIWIDGSMASASPLPSEC